MNAVISSVVKTQTANSAAAGKLESDAAKSAEEVTGGRNTAAETSVSSKYDTLDLSRDYLEFRTQSENSSIQDLYAYTESELLNMVNHVKISREEYEAEIASRDSRVTAV